MKNITTLPQNLLFRVAVILVWLFIAISSSQAQTASGRFLIPDRFVTYSGYEISVGMQNFKLDSDIPELNALNVTQIGARVGAVLVNRFGKIRPSVGLYYSDGSTARTVDMAQVSLRGNLYLLRLVDQKMRFLEPYAVASFSFQRMKFFGTYLSKETTINYSLSKEPLLGNMDGARGTAGLGLEVHIANDSQHFIHLFTEVQVGYFAKVQNSNEAFRNTTASQPIQVALGISFGLSRF